MSTPLSEDEQKIAKQLSNDDELRDQFAGLAMHALLMSTYVNKNGLIGVNSCEFMISENAYKMADTMLGARKK